MRGCSLRSCQPQLWCSTSLFLNSFWLVQAVALCSTGCRAAHSSEAWPTSAQTSQGSALHLRQVHNRFYIQAGKTPGRGPACAQHNQGGGAHVILCSSQASCQGQQGANMPHAVCLRMHASNTPLDKQDVPCSRETILPPHGNRSKALYSHCQYEYMWHNLKSRTFLRWWQNQAC